MGRLFGSGQFGDWNENPADSDPRNSVRREHLERVLELLQFDARTEGQFQALRFPVLHGQLFDDGERPDNHSRFGAIARQLFAAVV